MGIEIELPPLRYILIIVIGAVILGFIGFAIFVWHVTRKRPPDPNEWPISKTEASLRRKLEGLSGRNARLMLAMIRRPTGIKTFQHALPAGIFFGEIYARLKYLEREELVDFSNPSTLTAQVRTEVRVLFGPGWRRDLEAHLKPLSTVAVAALRRVRRGPSGKLPRAPW